MRLITLLSTIFICQLGSTQILSETISVKQDATTRVAFPTTNYGNIDSIYCGFEAATGAYQRLYLEFSMDALPPEAIITSAKLVLHPKSIMPGNNNDLTLSRLDSNWIDTSITWNNQPGVITSDQVQIADSETTDPVKHEFDVIDHLEYFNFYEHLNFGWELRMYSETGASNTGISYYSQECVTDSLRPRLQVEYIMPLDFDINVSHCNQDSTNGSYTVNVNEGGSGGLFALYYLRKRTDTTWVIQSSGVPSSIEDVESENLSPGLYALILRDSLYTSFPTSRRYLLEYYKWFLIGEEGKITTVNMATPGGSSGEAYFEDVAIGRNTQTNPGGTKYSDINYNTGSSFGAASTVPTATFGYDNVGLLKFEMDFDPSLDFNSAELILNKHYYYNGHNSENSVNCRRITSWWRDAIVTWNTRPDVDSTVEYVLPTVVTTGSGGGPDTLNLLGFVEFWQLNQDENYGIEMSVNYGQSQNSHRHFKPSKFINTGPNLKLSFTVKDPLVASFDEATGLGSIEVNAPSGELPYTYLIGYESMPTMSQIWNSMKDSINVDSSTFWRGDNSTKHFVFTQLPAGEYFTGVYDNSGTLLMNQSIRVGESVLIAENVSLTTDLDLIKVEGAASEGFGTLYAYLPEGEDGGFDLELDDISGDFIIGFNKENDTLFHQDTLAEFGLKYTSSTGQYSIVRGSVSIAYGNASLGDVFRLVKNQGDLIAYKNGVQVATQPYNSEDGSYKLDVKLLSSTSKIKKPYFIGSLMKPKPATLEINHVECPNELGSVILGFPASYFKFQSVTYSIVNIGTSELVATGTVTDWNSIPLDLYPGNYSLTYSYNAYVGGTLVSFPGIVSDFTLGYVVDWVNLVNTVEVASTVNTITPSTSFSTSHANSVNFTEIESSEWLEFNWDGTLNSFSDYGTAPSVYGLVAIKDFSGNVITEISTQNPGLGIYLNYYSIEDGSNNILSTGWSYSPSKWRVEFDNASFAVFRNSAVVVNSQPHFANGMCRVYSEMASPSVYPSKGQLIFLENTISSFCSFDLSNTYFTPERNIHGGYYLVPDDDVLRVEFYEEYVAGSGLNFIVRNKQGKPMNIPSLTEEFGDNRFEFDVSALDDNELYSLELINDKNESFYLKFKTQ